MIVTSDNTTDVPTPEKKKVTKLETTNPKDAGKRRLVEYFVVVSSTPTEEKECEQGFIQEAASFEGDRAELIEEEEDIYIDDFNFKPTITARFPLEDHAENPLHESVTFFCHPSGNIQLRTELSMPKVREREVCYNRGIRRVGSCRSSF